MILNFLTCRIQKQYRYMPNEKLSKAPGGVSNSTKIGFGMSR